MNHRPILACVMAGTALALIPAGKVWAQVHRQWQTISLVGAPAAGVPGATYADLDEFELALDDLGRGVFAVKLAGPGIDSTNQWALYRGGNPASVELVARQGQPTPGGSGVLGYGALTSNPFSYLTAKGGRLAFYSPTHVPGQLTIESGAFTMLNGAPTALALSGQWPLPGLRPGEEVYDVGGPRLFSQDAVGFGAYLAPPGATVPDAAIYAGPIGSPVLVARRWEPSPIPGADYAEFYGVGLASGGGTGGLSPSLLGAALHGPGIDATNNRALFIGTPGSMTVVARAGDPAPGVPGGVFAGNSDSDVWGFGGTISPAGHRVLFSSQLTDGTYTLHVGTPANPQLAARTGQSIPGAPGALSWFSTNDVTDDGRFVGWAYLELSQTEFTNALFTNTADSQDPLGAIAVGGQQVPGQPQGVNFARDIGNPSRLFSHPALGTLFTFTSQLAGPAVTEDSDWALFLGRLDADPLILAREGDLIEVAPGDFRRLVGTWTPTDFNDLGQVATFGFFADGSQGVFVITVPEPASASLILFVASMLLRRRKAAPRTRIMHPPGETPWRQRRQELGH